MNLELKKFVYLILIMAIITAVIPAQITKKAQVGFRFLENPVSAEVIGKGGVGVVNQHTANSIFWNPALLGKIDGTVDIGLNHTKSIADINYNAAALAVNWNGVGVFGVSLIAMDYGDFYGTVRAPNEMGYQETGTFSPSAFAVGLGFSQAVTDRFSYGVHLKYAHQNLGEAYISKGESFEDSTFSLSTVEYKKGVVAADVGAYYDFFYKGIKFGATLQNISPELKYEIQQFPLPFTVSFGATIEPLLFFVTEQSLHKFIFSIESRHPRDFGGKVKFGGEYLFKNIFTARVGYQNNYDERNWTVGVGIKQNFVGYKVRLDYALEPFGLFGDRHFISIGLAY